MCLDASMHYRQCFDTVGWLGIRKSIRPVKNPSDEVLAWFCVWSKVQMICIWSSWRHCHPIISWFVKIQNSFAFVVPAYPACPREEAIKRVSVCLNALLLWFMFYIFLFVAA